MIARPQQPFCLSRQHPELANRSPAPRIPANDLLPRPAAHKPSEDAVSGRENPSGKGL